MIIGVGVRALAALLRRNEPRLPIRDAVLTHYYTCLALFIKFFKGTELFKNRKHT